MITQGSLKKINAFKQMHHYIYSLSTELSTELLLLHPTMDYYIRPYYLHITESFEKFRLFQPILAKKIYDIYKFQIFKNITIFHNIFNIKQRLCLDCIRHF